MTPMTPSENSKLLLFIAYFSIYILKMGINTENKREKNNGRATQDKASNIK